MYIELGRRGERMLNGERERRFYVNSCSSSVQTAVVDVVRCCVDESVRAVVLVMSAVQDPALSAQSCTN